jgi:long-chain acyl-CoA synthetase
VRAVALGLKEIGFGSGAFGVVMARNRPEHVIADLGIVHAGGSPVSLYNTLAPEQIAYIVNHCEATVAFVEDLGFYEKFQKIRDDVPRLERIVLLHGAEHADPAWTMAWDTLLESGGAAHERDPAAFDASWRAVQPDDPVTLIYTSGTTGPPKGVIDTHRSVLWDLESYRRFLATGPDDRVISYLPLAHAADRLLSHWQSLVAGHTIHFCDDLAQLLPTMLDVRPTFFGAVPRVWEKLHAGLNAGIANEADVERRDAIVAAIETGREVVAHEQKGAPVPEELARRRAGVEPALAALRAKIGLDEARAVITGAAPTPPEVLEFFHALGLRIAEVWGMSELAAIGTMNPLDRPRIGTIGVALPGVECALAGDGELLVRGGLVMRGYYRDAAKTAEAIDGDGWLRTGDVAEQDQDGYVTIVDRKKELIITAGGKNISPANLESMLKYHPLIGQACVIGDNRPYLSALIVLDAETAPAWARARGLAGSSLGELAEHQSVRDEIGRAVREVNEHVSRVESIRRWTLLPNEWTAETDELTPTLKLKRRVIMARYAEAIEALYV